MTLTIDIADATDAQRVLDGLCWATNYNPASGKTKGQWVKEKLIEFLRFHTLRGEVKETQTTSKAEIDAIVIT